MLRLDPDQVLRSDLLRELSGVHGFGTRFASAWPVERTATLKQIHSRDVVAVPGPCIGAELGQGDALITNTPGVVLSIRTADCVPILLADPVRKAVAAVHAGWRGTVQQIVRETVLRMNAEYGTQPADLRAAIGPAIGPCCYEVSEEVAVQFPGFAAGCGKVKLDLVEENRRQLLDAGLLETHIDADPRWCTRCDSHGILHSFRRDGDKSGRMHAIIGL